MILFPGGSSVGRILPKEAFYKQLNLSTEMKNSFVSDIKRIVIENSLTEQSLHLKPGTEVIEVIVLSIELKKKDFENRILETIARQNKHKILFWLRFEDQNQLALYFNKLYKTDWHFENALHLETKGFTLDEVWNGYIEQIALIKEPKLMVKETSLTYRVKRQEEYLKLEKSIDQLDKTARAEKQPKKKFELAMQVQQLKKDLENL